MQILLSARQRLHPSVNGGLSLAMGDSAGFQFVDDKLFRTWSAGGRAKLYDNFFPLPYCPCIHALMRLPLPGRRC